MGVAGKMGFINSHSSMKGPFFYVVASRGSASLLNRAITANHHARTLLFRDGTTTTTTIGTTI